ncbi:macrophage mannose receptor 1-like [Kryptolebias marmoratus]|uniref:macrophage mannose receptor 1-like n=1 Tax=Kryptolebias marmoratus TaxID=37003 RepID=UPI0018ACB72C|nr:macrophage mannose receptor 1-like [Kryptolebias marmoratus]
MMRNICILVSLLLILHPFCGQLLPLTLLNFTHYRNMVTWNQAQSDCRERNMDLVSIKSEKENQVFISGQGWIGLYRDDNTSPWKWSRGDEIATFLNWHEGEPNDDEHCGFKMPDTNEWMNDRCDRTHTVMCSDQKLVLVKENKTWEEALGHCRSLGGVSSASGIWIHRYDLVTLISKDDHDYAREQAQQATTDEVWTGLRYLGHKWFWVAGEWAWYKDIPSCPAGRCGVLEKNSTTLFGIKDCSQRRNFFCYKKF